MMDVWVPVEVVQVHRISALNSNVFVSHFAMAWNAALTAAEMFAESAPMICHIAWRAAASRPVRLSVKGRSVVPMAVDSPVAIAAGYRMSV